ncbi:MAG TPA: hypothetical protein VKG62_08550 [Solirubrobacteraceae bacterium]|nr:hypothetical protein [Solirubrobacteraceae bacterium]
MRTCELCGEVIGVYEPLIAVGEGDARETSRAAEPNLQEGVECFHRACFETHRGELGPPE